jgi:hypothetical protein
MLGQIHEIPHNKGAIELALDSEKFIAKPKHE